MMMCFLLSDEKPMKANDERKKTGEEKEEKKKKKIKTRKFFILPLSLNHVNGKNIFLSFFQIKKNVLMLRYSFFSLLLSSSINWRERRRRKKSSQENSINWHAYLLIFSLTSSTTVAKSIMTRTQNRCNLILCSILLLVDTHKTRVQNRNDSNITDRV